ncbi:MAG: DNA recombination/repair protein RecA, partial [Truepera sp.]|nr:DNA recombination/repair protein RecA [Truepera sp.]
MNEQRKRSLDATILQIEKQYGKGAIMRLGTEQAPLGAGVISTGSLSIDLALGVLGVPRGR